MPDTSTPPDLRQRLRRTRVRAEVLFSLRAARRLAPILALLVALWLGTAFIERVYGAFPGQPPLDWNQSLFLSYLLLFNEHVEQVPPHWLAQLTHYFTPVLGVAVVSGGIINLGVTYFRKETNPIVWTEIMANASDNYVVLFGLGNVGYRVFLELHSMGQQVFAVERDPENVYLERVRELGGHVLVGDARSDGILDALTLDRARAVIAATDDDLVNIEVAMDVRERRTDIPIVMRLFDQRLAAKVKNVLKVEVSVSTSQLAAPLFATAALHQNVVGTHRVGDKVLLVLEIRVAKNSKLARTVGELFYEGVDILAWRQEFGSWNLRPDHTHVITEGEFVQVMVPTDRVADIEAMQRG